MLTCTQWCNGFIHLCSKGPLDTDMQKEVRDTLYDEESRYRLVLGCCRRLVVLLYSGVLHRAIRLPHLAYIFNLHHCLPCLR